MGFYDLSEVSGSRYTGPVRRLNYEPSLYIHVATEY